MAFSSVGGLAFEGDHLDLSYTKPKGWLRFDTAGHAVATPQMIFIGDPACGPMLTIFAVGGAPEDYKTYTHYHGSDQFRVILRGVEQSVNRLTFGPGEFAFQEAGMTYKEGLGGKEDVWSFLVVGDRRGAAAQMPLGDNSSHPVDPSKMTTEEIEAATKGFALFVEMAKTNPGGPKGIPSVATSLGECHGGFLRGSFNSSEGCEEFGPGVEAILGLWGDRTGGPAELLIKGQAGCVLVPSLTAATETVSLVVGGACRIGASNYGPGDMRFQAAGARQDAIVAGPAGARIVFLIADRRALPVVDGEDTAAALWGRNLEVAVSNLALERLVN